MMQSLDLKKRKVGLVNSGAYGLCSFRVFTYHLYLGVVVGFFLLGFKKSVCSVSSRESSYL